VETFTPKFRDDPNEKVYSLYQGIAPGGGTVTTVIKKSRTEDKLEKTRVFGPRAIQRGESGQVAVLVIGLMETSLDEMHYILEARKQKKFVPRRGPGEIAQMCALLRERRNNTIRYYRKNPSEAPKPKKRTIRLHLPVGFRMMQTSEPGLQVLARI
jgi:hypothetical protein